MGKNIGHEDEPGTMMKRKANRHKEEKHMDGSDDPDFEAEMRSEFVVGVSTQVMFDLQSFDGNPWFSAICNRSQQ